MKKLIIFGTGDIAQIAKYYFETDSDYEVIAFTVDDQYCKENNFEGLPLVPFSKVKLNYPTSNHSLFIALSYADMNRLREKKYHEAKELGYSIASYVSSQCTYRSQFKPGENAFIFEDNTIQPFVKIGDNVTLWSGNHIGHHSTIESHNFISSHVVISGHCNVKSYCFLGVNSTVGHQVELAEGTLLGAGAIVSKNTETNGVYLPARTSKIDKKSFEIKL